MPIVGSPSFRPGEPFVSVYWTAPLPSVGDGYDLELPHFSSSHGWVLHLTVARVSPYLSVRIDGSEPAAMVYFEFAAVPGDTLAYDDLEPRAGYFRSYLHLRNDRHPLTPPGRHLLGALDPTQEIPLPDLPLEAKVQWQGFVVWPRYAMLPIPGAKILIQQGNFRLEAQVRETHQQLRRVYFMADLSNCRTMQVNAPAEPEPAPTPVVSKVRRRILIRKET